MSLIAEKILPWKRNAQESHRGFQKSRIEGEVREVLQSEVFGERQFNMFVDQMIRLTINPKERKSTGRIIDKERKKIIFLFEFRENGVYAIGVQKHQEAIENEDEYLSGTVFQLLSYRQDVETKKRRPHLFYVSVTAPLSIQYDSYVAGESDYGLPSGERMLEGEQFLPDDKVRTFCQGLFSLYLTSENLPQPQPQNSIG